MAQRPDRRLFNTEEEFIRGLQKFYADQASLRMKDFIPLIPTEELRYKKYQTDGAYEWDYKLNTVIRRQPPAEELALVVAIKEEIKEAELLGWSIRRVMIEQELYFWLINQRPAGLVKGVTGAWMLGTVELYDHDVQDETHLPFYMSGDHIEHGIDVCIACYERDTSND